MDSIQGQLDSITESVICIPYDEDSERETVPDSEEDEDDPIDMEMFTHPALRHRDTYVGRQLRKGAYEKSWSSCMERIETVIRNMQSPVTDAVLEAIQGTYQNTLPLLPCIELPVFVVSSVDRSVTNTIFHNLREEIPNKGSDNDDSDDNEPGAFVTSLSPAACSNITNTMKSLISGFISNPPSSINTQIQAKHSASVCLASYDINVLKAWYMAVRAGRDDGHDARLVVLMKDFEQFDCEVVQQMFYICSQNIPYLPIVFVISLSTPVTLSGSFIHSTYPRSTLSLLNLKTFKTRGGMEALRELLLETFFSTSFDPAVIPGPSTIDYIVEQYSRYSMSLDVITTILQLVHLRHFSEPLTVFVHDELLGEEEPLEAASSLEQDSSQNFLQAIVTRLHHPEKVAQPQVPTEPSPEKQKTPRKRKERENPRAWQCDDISGLLELLMNTRESIHTHARRLRVAFNLFNVVQTYLVQHNLGYKNTSGLSTMSRAGANSRMSIFEMMSACLKGTLVAKEGKYMGMVIRKLSSQQLQQLLSRVYEYLHKLPSDLRREHQPVLLQLMKWMNLSSSNPMNGTDSSDAAAKNGIGGSEKLGTEFVEWLMDYLSERMTDVSELNMWDLWYTGNPSTISEVINPSPREAIVSALLHPDDYLCYTGSAGSGQGTTDNLAQTSREMGSEAAPDLTLLFRLYLESGKTINVYDWFQAFEVTLRAERKRVESAKRKVEVEKSKKTALNGRKGRDKAKGVHSSPIKKAKRKREVEETPTKRRPGWPRRRAASLEQDHSSSSDDAKDSDSEMEMDDEEAERWQREVLFRFLRSVQELDFLGFLKHTRRKRDHVAKTVFDLPE